MSRASTSLGRHSKQDVDGRGEAGPDERIYFFFAKKNPARLRGATIPAGRPCERRDPYGADSRLAVGAGPFLTFEARGYGSLRSQGRPVEKIRQNIPPPQSFPI